jgi:Rad3-related DNA helicase
MPGYRDDNRRYNTLTSKYDKISTAELLKSMMYNLLTVLLNVMNSVNGGIFIYFTSTRILNGFWSTIREYLDNHNPDHPNTDTNQPSDDQFYQSNQSGDHFTPSYYNPPTPKPVNNKIGKIGKNKTTGVNIGKINKIGKIGKGKGKLKSIKPFKYNSRVVNDLHIKHLELMGRMVIRNDENTDINTFIQVVKSIPNELIVLTVMRGKLSEGTDIPDDAIRLLIVFGVPYPMVEDPHIIAGKHYHNTKYKNTYDGMAWYSENTYIAIRQTMGRIVRHSMDYGVVILIDERYRDSRLMERLKLPGYLIHDEIFSLKQSMVGFYKLHSPSPNPDESSNLNERPTDSSNPPTLNK